MKYRITEISTTVDNHLYLVVEFMARGNVVSHYNDFVIGRRSIKRTYIGAIGDNGEVLEPDAYTEEAYNINDEIQEIIKNYMRRHDVTHGDKRARRILRGSSDLRGHRQRALDAGLLDKLVTV